MSNQDFSSPRRQAPLGVIILFGENVKKMVQIVAALVFATLYMKDLPITTPWIIGIAASIMAVFTLLQYLRFKFHVSKDELILEKGVLIRERLSIPLERIQTVHLSQNLLQQVFQVTGLKIDTAGSGKEELKINALSHSDAKALQDLLQGELSAELETGHEGMRSEARESPSDKRKVLVDLTLGELILVGLTENHIRSGLIAVGVLWGYYWQLKDMFQSDLAEQAPFDPNVIEGALITARPGLAWILVSILIFLLASVLVSMVRTILRYFNLKATLGEKSLQVSSGLVKRNAYSIPLNKIQIVTWQGSFLRDLPGFESLLIKQSRSGDEQSRQKIEIPACFAHQREVLEASLFAPQLQQVLQTFRPHPYYSVYLSIIYGLIGSAVAISSYVMNPAWQVLGVYLLYMALIILWVKKKVSRVKVLTDGEILRYERGWLFRDHSLLKVYKIQSVKFSQSIFQKRKGVAHLTLYTAGGELRLPFLHAALANELYHHFLYKVEVSDKNWM